MIINSNRFNCFVHFHATSLPFSLNVLHILSTCSALICCDSKIRIEFCFTLTHSPYSSFILSKAKFNIEGKSSIEVPYVEFHAYSIPFWNINYIDIIIMSTDSKILKKTEAFLIFLLDLLRKNFFVKNDSKIFE